MIQLQLCGAPVINKEEEEVLMQATSFFKRWSCRSHSNEIYSCFLM